MDEYEFSEELRTISSFKKDNTPSSFNDKSNNVSSLNNPTSKSSQLLKLLLMNAKKISKSLKDGQDKIDTAIEDISGELEKTQEDFNSKLNKYKIEFDKIKENANKIKSNNAYEINNIQTFLKIFYKSYSDASSKTKENDNLEILELFTKNQEYKSMDCLFKYCNEKLFNMSEIKRNINYKLIEEKYLTKKRRNVNSASTPHNTRSKSSNADYESDECAANIDNFNYTPLVKVFQSYFNKNKPTSSILIPHRKRIFVNYYLDDNKRTTKSFNIAHLRSLEEFKSLLEEVKLFIRTHKVTKD